MIKAVSLFFTFFITLSTCLTQEIQYKEKATGGFIRFYYDENYYLVDKNCVYKAIERVAKYDSLSSKFNGEFKDFNQSGKLILQGVYSNGLKNGKFISYHPNGKVKWEASYIENQVSGHWTYYYPDGKPMLVLEFENEDFKFLNFWDTFGNQKIINGEGEYEMLLHSIGFTDHGFKTYMRRGKVSNGKLDGYWYTYFITENKNKRNNELAFTEKFSQGTQESINRSDDFWDYYMPYEDFLFVPAEYFSRSEFFIVHGCSFDEYSGFLNFVSRKFNDLLSEWEFETRDTAFQFAAVYTVDKRGLPTYKKILTKTEAVIRKERNRISDLFKGIMYFIPSVIDQEPIKDEITLTGDFIIRNGKASLQYLKLEREKGH